MSDVTAEGPRPVPRVADVLADVVSRGGRSTWAACLVEDCRVDLAVSGVGLALADSGGLVGVAAATPGMGQVGEDLQFTLGEGPCRTAADTGRMVSGPDVGGDVRWVRFGVEAMAVGIRAAFSAPLDVGAVRIGVLDVYLDVPGPLSRRAVAGLRVYAAAATALLLMLSHARAGLARSSDAAELVDVRPVVHQAVGMASAQLETDLTTALLRLRAHAFATGLTLREVAHDVITRRLALGDTVGGADPPAPRPRSDQIDLEPRDGDEHVRT